MYMRMHIVAACTDIRKGRIMLEGWSRGILCRKWLQTRLAGGRKAHPAAAFI